MKQEENKGRKRPIFLVGLAGLALVAGMLGFSRYGSGRKAAAKAPLTDFDTGTGQSKPDTTTTTASGGSRYTYRASPPIRLYNYGPPVKRFQTALRDKFGAKITPDGYWGPLTEAAVKAAGLPSVIPDSASLDRIAAATKALPSGAGGIGNGLETAKVIARATNAQDSDTVMKALRTMRDTSDYRKVSGYLGNIMADSLETFDKFGNKANRNLVNTLLADRMNWSLTEKIGFAKELRRMGLVERSGKWDLSGLAPQDGTMVAIRDTVAWDAEMVPVGVPAGMVAGATKGRRGGLTLIRRPDGEIWLFETSDLGAK